MTTPEHNPVKLPLFVTLAAIGGLIAVVAALSANWLFVALGVVVLLMSLWCVRVIRQGRNPWYIRAPLDRRQPPRG